MKDQQHYYAQAWLLLISVTVFALYVIWDLGGIQLIWSLDRSFMATLIMALLGMCSVHCGWHVVNNSRRIDNVQNHLSMNTTANHPGTGLIGQYVEDLHNAQSDAAPSSDDAIVEIHADRIRGAVDLGWYLVDLAVRLGLLGTIIGFMLIFASLSGLNIEGSDDLTQLLIAMSGGMGTALLTTLSGLVVASLLGFQYLILSRQTEQLIGLLLRLRNHHRSLNKTCA